MAATVVSSKVLMAAPGGEFISEVKLSGLTAGVTETVTHLGPSGTNTVGGATTTSYARPVSINMMVTTAPTDGSPVLWSWTNSATAAASASIKFSTIAGGSLDGAVVTFLFRFIDQGAAGLTTITTA